MTINEELMAEGMRALLDDGTLDKSELQRLFRIALADGKIDDAEKQELRNIFAQVSQDQVTREVWQTIQDIRRRHGI